MTIFVTATSMTSDLTPVRVDLDPCHGIWQISLFPIDLQILHGPGLTRQLALTVMDYAEHLAAHDPHANGVSDHKCALTQAWEHDLARYLRQCGHYDTSPEISTNVDDFVDDPPF